MIDPGIGPDQELASTARIARFLVRPERTIAVADLTPAYGRRAERVLRGVAMLDHRSILVEDEVTAGRKADVWWFMHTAAQIVLSADGRTATLSQGGERLSVLLATPAAVRFEVRPAAPLPSSPHPPKQAVNEAVAQAGDSLRGRKNLRVAVLFVPEERNRASNCAEILPLSEW